VGVASSAAMAQGTSGSSALSDRGKGKSAHASHVVVEALAASVGNRVGLATLEEPDPLVATPITYNVFSKWAVPLNSRLRAIRDGIQAALRRHATLGGGRKGFAHAFRKLASRSALTVFWAPRSCVNSWAPPGALSARRTGSHSSTSSTRTAAGS
jgi:hypothetical protein